MQLKRLKRRFYLYLPYLKPIFYLLVILIAVYSAIFIGRNILAFFSQKLVTPKILISLFTKKEIEIKTQDHYLNILILGVAGGEHEGPDLSDTMIFASINIDKKKALLISIPRDIWISSMRAKINTAYTYGEEKKPGGGFTLSKAAVKEIFDTPVDYAVKIDFNGFVKAIDILGGIDVNIKRSFDDYKYPIPGKENKECEDELDEEFKCRYEHVHFDRGLTHMDGKTALIYVRSRNAEGAEGTDFARSQRQQQVLLAVKNKFFNLNTLLNPTKIKKLMQTFDKSIKTDIPASEVDDFIRLGLKLKDIKITTFSLDAGDEKNGKTGLLKNPDPTNYDGQWVLVPKTSWEEIQKKIKEKLKSLNKE